MQKKKDNKSSTRCEGSVALMDILDQKESRALHFHFMNYEEYEKVCELQQEKNNEYLAVFEEDLMASGLKKGQ